MEIVTEKYNIDFYKMVDKTAFESANIVLPIVLDVLPKINSTVDFDCGTGTWMSVLYRLGVKKYKDMTVH
jgi:hypothetical protein